MFTEQELKECELFKTLVIGRAGLIHNCYYNESNVTPAYIVIHSDMGQWTISRFWKTNGKIYGENDFTNVSTIEVFKYLLTKYNF